MSYDISVQKIVDGDRGLCTPEEARACVQLLRTITTEEPDEFNFLELEFDDGSSVEVSIWDDETAIAGCMLFTRGISEALVKFMFDLATAGNFVILDTGGADTPDSPVAIVTSEDLLATIGDDLFEYPKVCKSASELSAILGLSSEEWLAYRDHVVASYQETPQPEPAQPPFWKRLFKRRK